MLKKQDIESGFEDRKRDLQQILWWMFRGHNNLNIQKIDEVAPKLNISPDALRKYIRDDLTFPAFLISSLYKATKDLAIIEYIFEDCDDLVFAKVNSVHATNGTFEDEKDDLVQELAALIKVTNEAKADGEIDLAELAQMKTKAEEIKKTLDDFIAEGEKYNER